MNKNLIDIIPLDREFRATEIVHLAYPESVKSDSEGRTFNRGIAALVRILRKTEGVVEVERGLFFAASEFFRK